MMKSLRFAWRQMWKAPGFTLTVVLTLALGIGATTAIFSLVEGVLLRPLPFQDADRLVLLGDHLGNNPGISVTAREIGRYAEGAGAFSSMGGYITSDFEISGGAEPEELNVGRVNATVFTTLGVQPIVGRVFSRAEEDARQPLAVISYALWMNRYHRDPSVLGNSIVLDRKPYAVIGVMPRSFEFPAEGGRVNQVQLWIPLSLTPDELSEQQAGFWGYRIVARLRPGVSVQQAAQDADRVAKQTMKSFPPSMSAIRLRGDVMGLSDLVVRDVQSVLRALFLAVVVVLLIACANVSGLLLVRAIRRRREYAVRLAIGASSSAIVRESAIEGLTMSLAGGVVGLALAAAALRVSLRFLPESIPRISSISIDGTVAAFAIAVALLTGVICSAAPAFAALRTNLAENLKEGSRTGTGAASHSWLRASLVVAEVAVALVLLTVCGAFLRSFQKMREVDPGFRPDHLLVASFQLPLRQYGTDVSVDLFHRDVVEKLSSKPGTMAVAITTALPATDVTPLAAYTVEGVREEDWKLEFAAFAVVYGDYFRAMGIPVLDGRTFTTGDRADAALVVIVNETMAKHCWPGQRAVGKRIHFGNPQKGLPWATVVGVVADTAAGSRDEPKRSQWYLAAEQPAIFSGPAPRGPRAYPDAGYIALRSALPPERMIETLRSTVVEVDPLLALQDVKPMDAVISDVEAPRRFNTDLITAFALGALLLAMTGIYAVVAFSVSLRTQEIAIRMAVGAQRKSIARLVLVSGGKLALLGCVLGVAGSLAVSRLVETFLFDVSARDPWIYGAGVVLMLLVALAASAIPAMRAAVADPAKALRAT